MTDSAPFFSAPRSRRRTRIVLIAVGLATTLAIASPTASDSATTPTAGPEYPTTPAATQNPIALGIGMLVFGGVAGYFLFFRAKDRQDPT